MTAEEFKKQIIDIVIKHGTDPEAFHSEADDLMETLLVELGYGEGIDIIKNGTRWYA